MTQHKEEDGEDEEGHPEITSGIRDNKDSGEECDNELGVKLQSSV